MHVYVCTAHTLLLQFIYLFILFLFFIIVSVVFLYILLDNFHPQTQLFVLHSVVCLMCKLSSCPSEY